MKRILEDIKSGGFRNVYVLYGQEAYLQKQIQKYGLEGQVSLLGYRSDISDILQTADCFIFCSEREGLGIAALEALACEVPVIASDNRGTREYMQHRKNGLVCMNFQPEVYAEAIRILKESKGLIESMRSCCRKTAERFSIQETEKIMQIIYKREDSCLKNVADLCGIPIRDR